MKIELTYKLAHAAARDAANRHMRANGRKAWNQDDYNVAVEEFNRIFPLETHLKMLQTGEEHHD